MLGVCAEMVQSLCLPVFLALAQRVFAASDIRFLAAALSLLLGLAALGVRLIEWRLPFCFAPQA